MYKNNYSRYGVKMNDIDTVRDKLARMLDMKFDSINSDSWGSYYRTSSPPGEISEIGIHYNLEPAGAPGEVDELMDAEYPDYPVLISVHDAESLDFYDELLTQDPEFRGVLIYRDIEEDDD